MESDENRVYNAARLMVASLAGSLAHVTCKVCFLSCKHYVMGFSPNSCVLFSSRNFFVLL